MATILDVARKANVSAMTVSRVLNGTGYVREETRQRVKRVMEELNFIPNNNARGLVMKKTNMLSLLISDITNPFFTTLARGAEDSANRQNYRMLFGNSDEDINKEKDYVEMLLSSQVDGVLFAPSGDDSIKHLRTLRKHQIPFVILDREVPGMECDQVLGDNLTGTRLLIEHLIQLGHRRIACLTGPQHISTARERRRGFLETLLIHGIPVDHELILETNYKVNGGVEAIDHLLQKPLPSAIFAANNFVALGAIQALKGHGLRVPEDISIVTFDDLGLIAELDPFLTVAAQPAYDFGSIAVQLLIDRIQGTAPTEYRKIILPPQLMIRGSSSVSSVVPRS